MGKRVKVPVLCPEHIAIHGACKRGDVFKYGTEQQLLAIGGPLHGQEINWSAIPEQEQNNYIRFNAASGLRGLKRGERYYPKAVWLYGPDFEEWSDNASLHSRSRFACPAADADRGRTSGSYRAGNTTEAIANATGTPYGEGFGVAPNVYLSPRGPGW